MAVLNEKGQMAVEAVLIMVLLVSIFTMVTNGIKDNEVMVKIVSGPWDTMRELLANGVLEKSESKVLHPNRLDRHLSPEGDPPK